MSEFFKVQPVLLGSILVLGGLAKLRRERGREAVRQSAFALLVRREGLVAPAWELLGCAELLLGLLLLLAPPWQWVRAATVVHAFWGDELNAVWAWLFAPERSCGCFGGASTAPASWRTVARTSLLWAAAVVTAVRPRSWWQIHPEPQLLVLVLLEALVFVWLSPEVPTLLRQFRVGQARLPRCLDSHMSAEEALEALRRSHAWDGLSMYVRRAEPSEHWRDGCWRFLAFPAEYSGRGAHSYLRRSRSTRWQTGTRRARGRACPGDLPLGDLGRSGVDKHAERVPASRWSTGENTTGQMAGLPYPHHFLRDGSCRPGVPVAPEWKPGGLLCPVLPAATQRAARPKQLAVGLASRRRGTNCGRRRVRELNGYHQQDIEGHARG